MEFVLENMVDNACNFTEYQYFTGLQSRRIVCNSDVTEDIVERVMLPLLEMDGDGSGEPITLIINTNGGSLYDGMPLCDIIDNMKTPLTTIVLSHAYSMGIYILMAGYKNPNVKRVCYKHSTALLHGGSIVIDGTISNARDTLAFQEAYENKLREYVLTHSKLSREDFAKAERFEWYMDSDEMLRFGLVDEVIGA